MDRCPSSSSFTTGRSIYSEIMWGSKFRKRKRAKDEQKQKLASQQKCGVKKKQKCEPFNPCAKIDALFSALNAEGKKQYADPFKVIQREEKLERMMEKCRKKKYGNGKKKAKIVNRDLLTRRQHIELLAKPRVIPQVTESEPSCSKTKTTRRRCCRSTPADETCLSPRLKQLALPTKRLVHANWCAYQHILDADTVVRMENILVAGKGENLDNCETRKYFRSKDKRKRKTRKKKCKALKLQRKRERTEKEWLTNEVNILADLIVHSFAREPLRAENSRHIQLTSCLIATLKFKGFKIKPISRKTKNVRKKTVLGIFDHVSVWADRVFQEAEQKDLEINVRRYEKMLERYREQEEAEREAAEAARVARKRRLDKEIVGTFINVLEDGNGSDLNGRIHNELLPNVTYALLLEKLRQMQDDDSQLDLRDKPSPSLRQALLQWTQRNRPQLLSDVTLNAIDGLSRCLPKMFDGGTSATPPKKHGAHKRKEKKSKEDVLRSMSEEVDLSEIPTYTDPNEDLKDETVPEGLTDDESGFDTTMYVGSQDVVERRDG